MKWEGANLYLGALTLLLPISSFLVSGLFLLAMVLVLCFVTLLRLVSEKKYLDRTVLLVVLFAVLYAYPLYSARYMDAALMHYYRFLAGALGFLNMALWGDAITRSRSFRILTTLSLTALVFYGGYQFFYEYPKVLAHTDFSQFDSKTATFFKSHLESRRVTSAFPSPDMFSSYILLLSGIVLAFGNPIRLRSWVVPGLLGAGLAASVYFSRSVGGGLLLALFTAFYLVHRWRQVPSKYGKGILMLLLLGAGIALAGLFQSRIHNFALSGEGDNSVALRLKNWEAAGKMYLDYPWFGIGHRQFGYAYKAYKMKGANDTIYAHNSYFQELVEMGTVLFILLAALLLILTWPTLRRLMRMGTPGPTDFFLACTCLMFALKNIWDYDFYLEGHLYVFALALGWLVNNREEDSLNHAPA